jgi:predicted DNA-binding transcriptional regulator YafY
MNKLERLTGILLLLQTQSLTSEQIAAHFEISRRTVLRDIQALSELGVPVEAVSGPGGGYRLHEAYLLAPLPLTAREAALLLLSLSAMSKLGDVPFAAEHASLLAKLRALLPQPLPDEVDRLLAVLAVDIPERQQAAPFLEALVQAAQEGRAVRVVYQSAERQSTQHLLPRSIQTQNGYWYCYAYAVEHEEERAYRVDRIRALTLLDELIDPATLPTPQPYDHESHPQIVATLTPRGVAEVESEPHLGQRIQRQPDGSGLLMLRCPPGELRWYSRYFAGLGADVDVTAPPELRDRLHAIGQMLAERYQSTK